MIRSFWNQANSFLKSVIFDYWSVLLIYPALFLYIFSNEINIICLYGLVYRKICLHEFNETICNSIKNYTHESNHVQSISSLRLIYLNMAFLIPAIFAIIYMASIGDRRLNYRAPLLVSLVGSLFQALICVFSVEQETDTCLTLLFIAQFVNGILGGGSLAFISSCFSHLSIYEDKQVRFNNRQSQENSQTKYRSIRYSICESCLLLGQFLGSFLSGYFIGNKINIENFKITYVVSFSIYFVVLIYTLIMFEYLKRCERPYLIQEANRSINNLIASNEELKVENNNIMSDLPNQQHSSSSNSIGLARNVPLLNFIIGFFKKNFGFLNETWILLSKRRERNARFQINSLLILFFFGASISLGIVSLQYLYLVKKPISLLQTEYGIFKAMNTLFRAIALLIVLPILKSYFQMPDYVLFVLGLVSELLNLVVFFAASFYSKAIWFGKSS